MNEDRIAGTVKSATGKIEEGFGKAVGDIKSQAEGKLKQMSGTAQDLYGQAQDSAGEAIDTMRQGASSLEETLRNTIETRPYTAVLAALAVGWLIGRTGRPSY